VSHANSFFVITFPTTHNAIKFETCVKQNQINARLIPVPRVLSANCGLCGRTDEEGDLEAAVQLCREEQIDYEGVFKIPGHGKGTPESLEY